MDACRRIDGAANHGLHSESHGVIGCPVHIEDLRRISADASGDGEMTGFDSTTFSIEAKSTSSTLRQTIYPGNHDHVIGRSQEQDNNDENQ